MFLIGTKPSQARAKMPGVLLSAGAAAMKMTVTDWRNRASECLVAARRASTPQDKVQWLILHDAWCAFADLRERGQSIVIATAPNPVKVTAGRGRASVEGGNRLRARLTLVTNSDAR
ncbi:MAG: hypothetical protein WBE90_00960 [Xanthobacteraceae bacterium]